MEWLSQIAPSIATALGGPLAGLAVTAISKALGIDEKDVQSTIESGKLSADQLASLKKEIKKKLEEMEIPDLIINELMPTVKEAVPGKEGAAPGVGAGAGAGAKPTPGAKPAPEKK
jgi:hypothetical protein